MYTQLTTHVQTPLPRSHVMHSLPTFAPEKDVPNVSGAWWPRGTLDTATTYRATFATTPPQPASPTPTPTARNMVLPRTHYQLAFGTAPPALASQPPHQVQACAYVARQPHTMPQARDGGAPESDAPSDWVWTSTNAATYRAPLQHAAERQVPLPTNLPAAGVSNL